MEMQSLFSIENNIITNFTPLQAVVYFRKLLWAEARLVGIGGHLIDVPECINVGDGGIDAIIDGAQPVNDEVIPQGTTGFQIKASDLQPRECILEIHKENNLKKPLKPEIQRILDNGGNYVLVLFADITPEMHHRRKIKIEQELSRLGYKNEVRVYSASQLIEFSNKHIALVSEYNRIRNGISHSQWSQQKFMQMPAMFVVDEQRTGWIEQLRYEILNQHDQTLIFRVTGLSGIGKTRLVFEALNIDGIRQSVIYLDARLFLTSELFFKLQNDTTIDVVLVVDECSNKHHDEIVRAFDGPRSGITIITISYEKGSLPSPTKLFDLQPLDDKKIREIIDIEFPSLLHEVASRLTRFADGFPRIAVLLGESYLENGLTSDDIIRVSDSVLMNRLLGISDPITEYDRKLIRVLQAISIFGKIGIEGSVSNEAEWLANFANVTLIEFHEIIREQKERGIVQGQYFIYISPIMLQIHLLSEWWETHGFSSIEAFDGFFGNIPGELQHDLLDRFLDQLPFSGATEQGREFAESILKSDLFMENYGEFLKTEVGSRFFLKLSEANLSVAITILEKIIGNWSDIEIKNFKIGRRNVVWALEKSIAYKKTFTQGITILLRFAENENEPYSNNATGIFASLFTPISGELSPTEAPPSMRLPILEEAVKSSKPETRIVAIAACDTGLETRFFSRTIENPLANLRKVPRRWTAKTYAEIFKVYQDIWDLLVYVVKNPQNQNEQLSAFKILVNRSAELSEITSLSEMVISTFEELKEIAILKNPMLEGIIQFLRYRSGNIDPKIIDRWDTLQEELTGTSYVDLLHRYVSTNIFEEQYDKDGNPTNILDIELSKLVNYSFNHHNEFDNQIVWMLSDEAINSQYFGYLLAQKDNGLEYLPKIIYKMEDAHDKLNLGLIGGYLRALNEKDLQEWEEQLTRLAKNSRLLPHLPEIIARSGITDNAVELIMQLVKENQIPTSTLVVISSSREIRQLSKEKFLEWTRLLLREEVPNSFEIAIKDMYLYFIFEKEDIDLPAEFTFDLLTIPYTKGNIEFQNKVMVDYYWQEVSRKFLCQYPDKQIGFLEIILNYFSNQVGLSTLPHSQPYGIMTQILHEKPDESWVLILKVLNSDNEIWKYNIFQWLRGEKWTFGREPTTVPLIFIPDNLVWNWVKSDIPNNAKVIARLVPSELFHKEGEKCFARELLVRYGDREDVRQELIVNFCSGSWTGPASMFYSNKMKDALDYKEHETDKNVLLWVDEYISSLDLSIKEALLREERRGY